MLGMLDSRPIGDVRHQGSRGAGEAGVESGLEP